MEQTARAGQGSDPVAGHSWAERPELPGLDAGGKPFLLPGAEGRIQQDPASPKVLWHRKGVRKTPLAEKCPSAGPAAPCTVWDPPSLPAHPAGKGLGTSRGVAVCWEFMQKRPGHHPTSQALVQGAERRTDVPWPVSKEPAEAVKPGVTLLGVGWWELRGQHLGPREQHCKGALALLHTGCLSGS